MKLTPQRIKTIIYLLCLGLGVWLGFSFVQAQEIKPTAIPFTINQDEVQGGTKVLTSTGVYPLADISHIKDYLVEDRVSLVILRDDSYGDVAYDVVIGGVKETFEFNAENSAKGAVIRTLGMLSVPLELYAEAYALTAEHPRLDELRAMYLAAKRYPDTDEDFDLAFDIALEVREQLRAKQHGS